MLISRPFGISNTMLLYPKHIEDSLDENLNLGKKEDKIINLAMRCIDLGFSGEYDEYIEKIKERIKNINV